MAHKVDGCDNVRESFASTGTTITLGGAVSTYRALSAALTSGDTFWGVARKGAELSAGIFTYTSGVPGTVAQTTVFYSTNANAAVSFSSGTDGEIYADLPSRVLDILNLTETTVVSAATFDIGSINALRILASGTTGPITSFGSGNGKLRIVRWAGSALTHNSTSLILLGGASRTTASGDIGIYVQESAGNWREINYQPAAGPASFASIFNNYIAGLTLSWASTTTFSVASGAAADSGNAFVMNLASSITKSTSAWAVGSGNGGIDTGAIAASTWYHVYLIRRTDTGVVDVLFSTSASSPTMPTNYTQKRRIGSILTNGSSQFLKFFQNGDIFMWDVQVQDINSTNAGTAAVLRTMSTPLGVQCEAIFHARTSTSTAASAVATLFTDPAMTDTASTFVIAQQIGNTTLSPFSQLRVRTNTSSQIRTRQDFSDVNTNQVASTEGWVDLRGK